MKRFAISKNSFCHFHRHDIKFSPTCGFYWLSHYDRQKTTNTPFRRLCFILWIGIKSIKSVLWTVPTRKMMSWKIVIVMLGVYTFAGNDFKKLSLWVIKTEENAEFPSWRQRWHFHRPPAFSCIGANCAQYTGRNFLEVAWHHFWLLTIELLNFFVSF